MLGIILSLFAGLSYSIKDAFSKRALRDLDEYVVAWALRFFALPLIIVLMFFMDIPEIQPVFWFWLFFVTIVDITIIVLFMKAVKISELSLVIPIIAFTPLFILIISPFWIGELPGLLGIAGVVLVVLGAYTLNIKERSRGLFAPFKALADNKGARIMFFASFLMAITTIVDRVAIEASSALYYLVAIHFLYVLMLLPIVVYRQRKQLKATMKKSSLILPVGLFNGIFLLFHNLAIPLTYVSYVNAIEKVSILISVSFGYLFFKERNIKERFIGALIMVAGVIFMIFGK